MKKIYIATDKVPFGGWWGNMAESGNIEAVTLRSNLEFSTPSLYESRSLADA